MQTGTLCLPHFSAATQIALPLLTDPYLTCAALSSPPCLFPATQPCVYVYGAHTQGVGFIIQSDKYDASHLALQVELFVQQTVQRIGSLSEVSPGGTGGEHGANCVYVGVDMQCFAWICCQHTAPVDRILHLLHCPPAPPPHPSTFTSVPQEEFAAGVSELSKAKLEKPKRLSELVGRWWNEIYAGTYMFDRQVAEVEVLQALTQAELTAFAQEVLGPQSPARRKVAVLIRGSREFPSTGAGSCPAAADTTQQQQQEQESSSGSGSKEAGEAGSCAAPEASVKAAEQVCSSSSSSVDDLAYAASGVPVGEAFLLIQDMAAFKRGCEVWPVSGQQHSRLMQQQHRRQSVLSGSGAAAATTAGADSTGEAAAAAAAAKL